VHICSNDSGIRALYGNNGIDTTGTQSKADIAERGTRLRVGVHSSPSTNSDYIYILLPLYLSHSFSSIEQDPTVKDRLDKLDHQNGKHQQRRYHGVEEGRGQLGCKFNLAFQLVCILPSTRSGRGVDLLAVDAIVDRCRD